MEFPGWDWIALGALSAHQCSFLLAKKEGPWSIFARLRAGAKKEARENPKVRKSAVHRGIECQHCTSVWVSLPIILFLAFLPALPALLVASGKLFLLWTALASLSIFLNQTFTRD